MSVLHAKNVLVSLNRLAARKPDRHAWLGEFLRSDLPGLALIAVEVAIEEGDPIGRVLASLFSAGVDRDLCSAVLRQIPKETVALRELAVVVATEEWRKCAGESSEGREGILPDLAFSLTRLAYRLSEAGRQEEALEKALEATQVYQDLAQARPTDFLPFLAGSVNNVATALSRLGRREEAVVRAQESVHLYRKLADVQPEVYRRTLAMALNTLAGRLGESGSVEDALHAAQRSLEIWKQLAGENPGEFQPELAGSLANLAKVHGDAGRRREALSESEAAVRIYAELAQMHPDAFLPDLANALNTLVPTLIEVGQLDKAMEKAQEAARILGELAQARPEVFLPSAAMSLTNLALAFGGLRRWGGGNGQGRRGSAHLQGSGSDTPSNVPGGLGNGTNGPWHLLARIGQKRGCTVANPGSVAHL